MTNQAIAWTQYQKASPGQNRFFVYYARVPRTRRTKPRRSTSTNTRASSITAGDKQREITLANRRNFGVVPENAKLAPKPEAIKDWDKLTGRREEAVRSTDGSFAGFGEHTDHESAASCGGNRGDGRDGQHTFHLHSAITARAPKAVWSACSTR